MSTGKVTDVSEQSSAAMFRRQQTNKTIYQSARRNIQQDLRLYQHRCDNLTRPTSLR